MPRAIAMLLILLALTGCSGMFSGPPVKHQEPDAMREGPGLLSGQDGEFSRSF